MKHRNRATTAGLVLTTSAALVVGGAVTAAATQGHSKAGICHPVPGKGETGTGWVLESPDEASKHIDEALFAKYLIDGKTAYGKHGRKDGRTDVYADAAGHCPGWVAPTPQPSHTVTPSPSPSVTATSPSPSPSVTATSPTPSPSVVVTVPVPTPTPTPTDTAPVPSPTPSVSVTVPVPTSPAPSPSVTRPEPTTTSTASSTTAPPITPRKPPAPTNGAQVTELAQTGVTLDKIALGLMLVMLGAGLISFAGRNKDTDSRRPQ